MYLVSACLAGLNCKYDGGNNYNEDIIELVKSGEAILICPEQLGGLTTPRFPSEISMKNGEIKVINNHGGDVTKNYERGAQETLDLAKRLNIKKAILKAKSPSCGCGLIYDGTFSKTKVKGNGVTAQLLLDNGFEVFNEENFKEEIKKIK